VTRLAGGDQASQRRPHVAKLFHLSLERHQLSLGRLAGPFTSARRGATEPHELLNFVEGEAEVLSLPDEAHDADDLVRVMTVAVDRPARLCEKAPTLVISDRFDMHARRLGRFTDPHA